ncbi:palmitoyltransferase ZDHHC2-like isoform X2 [Dysidea avara]
MAGVVKTCVWLVFSCVHCLFWLPLVIVTLALMWGYYVYVYLINITSAGEGDMLEKPLLLRIVLLLIGHIVLFLQYTSFIKAVVTKHSPVPKKLHLTQEQLRQLDDAESENEYLQAIVKDLPVPVLMLNQYGGIRYCSRCHLIKPDRCHHCSLCGRCVLKMDHHCPWINNCVGFSNYKFFFLFLFYTIVLCLYIGFSSLYDVLRAWEHHSNGDFDVSWVRFNTVFLFFMCLVFTCGAGFLFVFHIYLVLKNRTTLESGRAPRFVFRRNCSNAYDLGWRRNLQQIFGTNLLIGFLPISSSLGDGCDYPMGRHCVRSSPEEPGIQVRPDLPVSDESEEEVYEANSRTPLTSP